MVIREEIINEVLKGYNSNDKKLEMVLFAVLNKYDIKLKDNALMCVDNSWENELETFLARKKLGGCTDATIKQYSYILTFVLSTINKPTREITEFDLYGFLHNYKKLKNVSDTTLLNNEKIIKAYFGWLHGKGIIVVNPAMGLDPIRCEKKVRNALTATDFEKLKNSCKTKRDMALVNILYATGMRISECQKLNIDDIDFINKRIVVYGKGRKEREVYLTDVSIMYLKAYLDSRTDNNKALFVSIKKPYNRVSVNGLEKNIRDLGKDSGVHSYAHRFRITLATDLASKGMPVEEIKEILGHSRLDTTMVYVNVNKTNIKSDFFRYA